jgi:gamma-glutamylcyclotransferase (GGCT)/AIG2-like uncharacterized protein YtfP
MEQLFVYGTLMIPEVQQRVFGRVTEGAPDRLDGWRKISRKFGDGVFPIAIVDAAASIDGRVLEVSPEEIAQMDYYEGPGYRRIRVTLASGIEAWVYCE